ncbi:hypothetical protein ACLOJK_030654 [Asimina triloba]
MHNCGILSGSFWKVVVACGYSVARARRATPFSLPPPISLPNFPPSLFPFSLRLPHFTACARPPQSPTPASISPCVSSSFPFSRPICRSRSPFPARADLPSHLIFFSGVSSSPFPFPVARSSPSSVSPSRIVDGSIDSVSSSLSGADDNRFIVIPLRRNRTVLCQPTGGRARPHIAKAFQIGLLSVRRNAAAHASTELERVPSLQQEKKRMACLALSIQPANGPDILLQTREWFPPASALAALASFRQTRLSYASAKNPNPNQSSSDADPTSSLGDDPLAASSGQLVVGLESRYRVVYRLVNSIYVLAITTADLSNVFECIEAINQAVAVVVAACRGVDVTPEKLHRKYAEIYMALDIILHGVSRIRLEAILSSIHGEGLAKMVHAAVDSENRVRGASSWPDVEGQSAEHEANVELFSNSVFELPPETLAAGDEIAATIAPAPPETQDQAQQKPEESASEAEKDPFAASDSINKPEELVGGFKKTKDGAAVPSDVATALAGLEVTTLPPAAATQSTFIGVEGFEGDYGGIEFNNEEATLSEAFEGLDNAFGGGLDASEFVGSTKPVAAQGLSGLELLQSDQPVVADVSAGGAPDSLENILVKKVPEMKGPEMYIAEEISVEFRESLLARVGLQGLVYLKTLPPKQAGGKETEFSFRFDAVPGVKRVVMQGSRISSLGDGLFHIRTAPVEEPVPILKYSLQPRFTPIPLRVRLIQRHSGTLLSVMIQYAPNPELMTPLQDVTFILKLPVDPTLLKVSPKAALNRAERELRWHVQEIPQKAPPGRLRARMPIDPSELESGEEIDFLGYVKFSAEGPTTLSGVSLRPVTDDKSDFYQMNNRYASGVYMCN